MELWTEYEGRTIDGVFPLTKLLRPEGRSAFFSTSNGTGVPTVIRLIESHFDDEEILARWRGVAALNHPNVLKLEKYGQVVMDETSLVYAVMEPVDANLGEVVNGQRLTVSEARQVAVSIVSVLKALHAHGFVHEHIEPGNVLAVGEVVKLRSDCIREIPIGEDGVELKKRDVRDLSQLLLQVLTQERTMAAADRDLPLPVPFDQIVRKGISGEWGIAQIAAALETEAAPSNAASAVVSVEAGSSPDSTVPSRETAAPPKPEAVEVSPSKDRMGVRSWDGEPRSGRKTGLIAAIGLAVVLLLGLGGHFLRHRSGTADSAKVTAASPVPVVESNATKPDPASAPAEATPPSVVQDNLATQGRDQWRVIVYTYNYEGQAQHKSATVAKKYPELQPAVFSPTGHAPYLVTVGGQMSREEAFALAQKARTRGLPRDTYAQNYTGKGH